MLVPSVIDYTLSRCEVDGGVLFADLEYDPEIFESQGILYHFHILYYFFLNIFLKVIRNTMFIDQ